MTKTYELPNEKRVMADVDEKHHMATLSVYVLDELVEAMNKTGTEALDMATKALEQEPCEDCISRTELIKVFENRYMELQKAKLFPENEAAEHIQAGVNWGINTIKALPSVQPMRQKGEFVWFETKIEGKYKETYKKRCKCSICDFEVEPFSSHYINFCPYCGADMRGEE